jgi:uncharacterized membrane protein YphA (DoxX/SURF4 family)
VKNVSNWKRFASWTGQLTVAGILLQTLFFKFSGASEAVFIFSTLGVEPWGRLVTGVVELLAGVLLLVPRTAQLGAFIAAAVGVGAIGSHLTILGIEVQDDGGLLFGLAWLVLAGSVVVLALRRHEWPLKRR